MNRNEEITQEFPEVEASDTDAISEIGKTIDLEYPSRKNHRYDFWKLEEDCLSTFHAWKSNDCERTRSDIFRSLYSIGYAILSVARWVPDTFCKGDKEIAAHEFSVYMYERIIGGTLEYKPNKGFKKFPVQQWFNLHMKKFVFKYDTSVSLGEEEFERACSVIEVSDYMEGRNDPEESYSKKLIANRIYQSLELYYDRKTINRLFPLVREIVAKKSLITAMRVCPEAHDFYITLMSILRRKYFSNLSLFLRDDYSEKCLEGNLRKALNSSFFLSALVNTDIVPKELFLSLDINNLYRLIEIAGGKTIYIPTENKMDSLIASAAAATKIVLDKESTNDAINSVKSDNNLVFSTRPSISDIINKTMLAADLEDNKASEPLFNTLFIVISMVQKMFVKCMETVDDRPNSVRLDTYIRMGENLNSIVSSVLSLRDVVDNKINDLSVEDS